jgi:hypothetical protein
MHKPSGPRYRRASERSCNAASMLLFLGTRERRVIGGMVTQSGQECKPPAESRVGRVGGFIFLIGGSRFRPVSRPPRPLPERF